MILTNDEIEVACDALWSVKLWGAWEDAQERLWTRLQPIRTGDFGGSATIDLEPEEEAAVARALRRCAEEIELDQDKRRLHAVLTPPMTLRDVIARLDQFEDDETIFAQSATPTARP